LKNWIIDKKITKNQVPKRDVEMLMLEDEKTGPELTHTIELIPDNVAKNRIKQFFGELSTDEVNQKLKIEKVAILLENPKWKLLKMGYARWMKKGGYHVDGLIMIFNNQKQSHDMDETRVFLTSKLNMASRRSFREDKYIITYLPSLFDDRMVSCKYLVYIFSYFAIDTASIRVK